MTVEHVRTMTTGLKWKELDIPINSPENDVGHMEGTDDWVQYLIDQPMVEEPGRVFEYSSGDAGYWRTSFRKKRDRMLTPTGRNTFRSARHHQALLEAQLHWHGGYRKRSVSRRRGPGKNRV